MGKLREVIEALPGMLCMNGVPEEEIKSAEEKLGLCFSEEYREYLQIFGAVTADRIELTGLNVSKRIDVVEVTLEERTEDRSFPKDMYVIENVAMDHLLILQNKSGEIHAYQRGGVLKKIAENLCEYLKRH